MGRVILDDRLLIEELLVGLPLDGLHLATTAYWYYRACRAAVVGAGGHLSGPFTRLDLGHQASAIRSLLELRPEIDLPDPCLTIPAMAKVAEKYPRLNLLNLEVIAAAGLWQATVCLSKEASAGVLPGILETEGLEWRVICLD